MNLPTWYSAGTVSVEGGSTTVTGTGALWGAGGVDDNIMAGDLFCVPSQPLVPAVPIVDITADDELELLWPWPGEDVVGQSYIIRYVGIIERSTRANRMALERMGQISANYDVQVNNEAARLALETAGNPLRSGYRVLVSETNLVYSKKSGVFGDWTEPASFSGPAGPLPEPEIGEVTTVPNGTPASASVTPTEAGFALNLTLPEGEQGEKGNTGEQGPPGDQGVSWAGAWDIGAEYQPRDITVDNDAGGDPAAWVSLTINTGSRPRDNPADWAYFPGSFPTVLDYGSITAVATNFKDYGTLA